LRLLSVGALRLLLLRNKLRDMLRVSCYEPRCEATWFVTSFATSRPFGSMIVERPFGAFNITTLRADEVFVFGFFNDLQNLTYNMKPKNQVL
jgi:hypothetical protein